MNVGCVSVNVNGMKTDTLKYSNCSFMQCKLILKVYCNMVKVFLTPCTSTFRQRAGIS
jgi:hypothetical protein